MAQVTSLGLGKTMEKKLHSVGIHSAEELIEIGSKQAVFRLKEISSSYHVKFKTRVHYIVPNICYCFRDFL